MTKRKEPSLKQLKEAIAKAEQATTGVTAPELRSVAFDRVLQYLLQIDIPLSAGELQQRKEQVARPKEKAAKSSMKPGPKAWLMELVKEGLFKTPRSLAQIREALAKKGHILKPANLTHPLATLTDEKVLRRDKMASEDGGTQVHWYNW